MAFGTHLLNKLYLEKDLSIDREVIERGHIRHWWKCFSKNMTSAILLNLMFLIFCLPIIFLYMFLRPALEAAATANMNFVGDLGFGFLGSANDIAAGSIAVYKIRMMIFALFIPCFSIVGIGASGAFYCARNISWGANVKLRKHFFRGIKKYWWQYIVSFTVIGIEVAAVACSVMAYLMYSVTQVAPWWTWICMIFSCLITLLTLMIMVIYLPMITQYRIKERYKLKNSVILAMSTILPLIVVLIFMGVPLLFMISGTTSIILLVVFVLFGFVMYMLGMTEYSQFCSDNFIKVLYEERERREEREKLKAINQSKKLKNKKNKGKR